MFSHDYNQQKDMTNSMDGQVWDYKKELVDPCTEPIWKVSKPLFNIRTGQEQQQEDVNMEMFIRKVTTKPFDEMFRVLNFARNNTVFDKDSKGKR